MKRLLYWTPRALCILFAAFISLFALDVFNEGYGRWEMILALLAHLVPTAIILVVLAACWRWEWIGGVLFTVLGAAYAVIAWPKFGWGACLLISGPLVLIGVLFLVNWRYRAELRAEP
jgi:signal transduction histidine kinase